MNLPQCSKLVYPSLNVWKHLNSSAINISNSAWFFKISYTVFSGGGALSQSLLQHGDTFDPLLTHMVRAGQVSGNLNAVLNKIASYREKQFKVKKKIKSATAYPMAFMGVTLVVVPLITFIIPRFEIIFHNVLQGTPPFPYPLK